MAMLAAHKGIGGGQESGSAVHTAEPMSEDAAIELVTRIVRAKMSPELRHALADPKSHDILSFEIEKGLNNIKKWFGPKS